LAGPDILLASKCYCGVFSAILKYLYFNLEEIVFLLASKALYVGTLDWCETMEHLIAFYEL
jgi:hypothetical protein